jgi:hypothetical protein
MTSGEYHVTIVYKATGIKDTFTASQFTMLDSQWSFTDFYNGEEYTFNETEIESIESIRLE